MARNALGTWTSTGGSGHWTQSIACTAGATVVVALQNSNASGSPDGISLGGVAYDNVAYQFGANGETWLVTFQNVAGGTLSLDIDFTTAVTWLKIAVAAEEYTDVIAASVDKITQASGTSTSPSSGATAATAQADEYLVGCIGTEGPSGDTAPTWSNSFTSGQRAGTTGGTANQNATIATGYKSVSATGAYTAAATGITSRRWDACIVTLKKAAAAITATVSAASMAFAAQDLAGSPGPVSATMTPGAAVFAAQDIVGSPGPITAVMEAATMSAEGKDLTPTIAPLDSTTITTLAATLDDGSAVVTVRSTTAVLGDADLNTGASDSTPGTWPNTKTLTVNAFNFASGSIDGHGDISGIKIRAYARIRKDTHPVLSNPRFTGAFGSAATSMPVSGPYSGVPDYAVVETALITTRDGTHPWTWGAAMMGPLANTSLKVDASVGGAYVGELAQLDVAEMWIEIYGPAGSIDDTAVIHAIGGVSQTISIGSNVSAGG